MVQPATLISSDPAASHRRIREVAASEPSRQLAAVPNPPVERAVVSKSVPESDARLVSRMATGDEKALAELYDRHGRMAWSLAFAILGEAADAEESVADAFLQIWTSAGDFDATRATVAGWLTMITRTRALDRLRSRRRRGALVDRVISTADVESVRPSTPDSPDVVAEHNETSTRIAEALDALPPNQKRAIELAFFGGLSHTEIAEAIGEPLGTVKTRLRSAMSKLRSVLAVQA